MNAITQTTATTDQIKQINRFGSDAIEKVLAELGLDNPGAQRVIEHGDEFAEAIRSAAIASLKCLSVSDKFKDEEVDSNYGYRSDYKPKGLTKQTNRLRELFPSIGYANDEKLAEGTFPPNAEGWFAIPRWEKIAPTYNEAVQKVLDLIKQTRSGKFFNYREGQLGPKRLRQTTRAQKFWETLGNEQKDNDILVVPAQFGLRHRGRSVRRAREVMQENEFGLGAFAIGIMILTHPKRLMNCNNLYIDCAGDEFDDPDTSVRFDHAPVFGFGGGRVKFDSDWFGHASGHYGSASAFIPQQ